MPQTPQTYENHTRFDPPYTFFLGPVALLSVPFALWTLWQNPGLATVAHVVAALAFVIAVVKIRTYALKVQDRVIRLEERLRLMELLPEKTRKRIGELTEGQLVALRFASDAEVPALVEKVLETGMKGKEIKKAIQTWRPDYFRV